jgi:superfamily II DNA/RNA helicase
MIQVSEEEKYPVLIDQLNQREGAIIVFVKTKYGADKLAAKLRKEKHDAEAIHGDLRHNKRERVINAFRNSKYRVLVATDVAARGIDISHVRHVINYDLPQCEEDYLHRIGRTARAGAEGAALCLVSPADRGKWRAISNMMNPGAKAPGTSNPEKKRRKSSDNFGRGYNGYNNDNRNSDNRKGARDRRKPHYNTNDAPRGNNYPKFKSRKIA